MAVIAQTEQLKKALAWAVEAKKEAPERSLLSVVDEAGMRFNLSPAEGESLTRILKTPMPETP